MLWVWAPSCFILNGERRNTLCGRSPSAASAPWRGEDETSDDPKAFGNKAVWKRIIVVVAGAIMNILLGVVLMMIIIGQQSAFSSTTIAEFTENSLTQQSGLQKGMRWSPLTVTGYIPTGI